MKGRCREVSTFSFTRKVGKAKKFFPSSPRRGEGRKIFFQARHVVGKAEKFFLGPPRRGEGEKFFSRSATSWGRHFRAFLPSQASV